MSAFGYCIISKILFLECFIYLVGAIEYHDTQIQEYLAKNPTLEPWMGFLFFRDSFNEIPRITTVILIAPYFALGYATQISLIDRKYLADSTVAIFPGKIRGSRSAPWELLVKNFFVHPEFIVHTVNSVGIVQLNSTEEDVPASFWAPVNWPLDSHKYHHYQSLTMIGFVEKNTTLKHIHRSMDVISQYDCKEFYVGEQMDYKYLWPTNYICFTETYSKHSCVYDQGLAVFDNSSSKITLLGISTTGPGCKLPSRFIEFFPYISWIQKTISNLMPTRRSKFARVGEETPPSQHDRDYPDLHENIKEEYSKDYDYYTTEWPRKEKDNWVNDDEWWKTTKRPPIKFDVLNVINDLDDKVTGMVYDDTVSFKMVDKATQTWQRGDCDKDALTIVYQETGYFVNPFGNTNTAHYVFSLYDTKHEEVTCIKAKLYTPGIGTDIDIAKVYETDSFYQQPIQFYIKHKPKTSFKDWRQSGKNFVLKDYYQQYYRGHNSKIITFELHFMIRNQAEIHVVYYTGVETTTTPATTTTRKYTTKKHKTYEGVNVYKRPFTGQGAVGNERGWFFWPG